MSEPFIAEIRMWACNFAPRSWAFCNGQLLPISENTALFALIGTIYGGDGRTTMALPNLSDRVPMNPGNGPGLTPRRLGERSGQKEVTLTEAQLPQHDHILNGVAEGGNSGQPSEAHFMGQDVDSAAEIISYTSDQMSLNANLSPQSLANAGQSLAHENRQPLMGINFCIALQGLFPSRS
ncbi:phage tail protein [Pleionea mediterranea]|uniref:Microcystin-dependent protein n=1 Tax=Pleionea mediterranea TaxID=523701 RepID=A0A316FR18_9GAMM|nr:tail fiber protein [Pleionea mediterranea]PWK50753.1 microcystin-dependent protein [Pleionea mediterranea]